MRQWQMWEDSGALLRLEVGEAIWGVLEPIRAGDVSVAVPALDEEGNQSQLAESQDILQSSLTSPALTAAEVASYQKWLGSWIARTYASPDSNEDAGADAAVASQEAERGAEAGLYVEEAVRGHAVVYG